MTEEQLKKIIANNYCGDPAKGYGFDYGADLKDEIDQRLWELQQKKQETDFDEYQRQLNQKELEETIGENFKCYYCNEIKSKEFLKMGSFRIKTKRGKCKPCHALKCKKYKEEVPF